MQDWVAAQVIRAQAVVVEVEGMKATNKRDELEERLNSYHEAQFQVKAEELQSIANYIIEYG